MHNTIIHYNYINKFLFFIKLESKTITYDDPWDQIRSHSLTDRKRIWKYNYDYESHSRQQHRYRNTNTDRWWDMLYYTILYAYDTT